MAEPKKETFRINVPVPPETTPLISSVPKQDTTRIRLPERPPTSGVGFVPPPAPPKPSPSAPFASPVSQLRLATSAAPPATGSTGARQTNLLSPQADSTSASGVYPGSSVQPSPKKEIARIAVQPPASPSINMRKTQPLLTRPDAHAHVAPVTVTTSAGADTFDSIPNSVCWSVLGLSALVLLIQIWNYFST